MLIRTKIIGFLLILFLALLGTVLFVQIFFVLPAFKELEISEARKNMSRLLETLSEDIVKLDQLTIDWAGWDDTYAFVVDRNQEYIKANLLTETFVPADIDLLFIFNRENELVWGRILDVESEELVEFRDFPQKAPYTGHPLLAHDSIESKISGMIRTEKGFMLVSSRPIITSLLTGPIRGTFIMGRFFDKAEIEKLGRRIHQEVVVWPVDQAPDSNKDGIINPLVPGEILVRDSANGNSFETYALYADTSGKPQLLFEIKSPKEIIRRGNEVLTFGLVMALVAGAIIFGALFWGMNRFIFSPLLSLARQTRIIGRDPEIAEQLPVRRNDEIGDLARAVRQSIKEYQRAEENLKKARDAAEKNKELADQANQAKSEFLSSMSHELRTPLNAILGFAELMLFDESEPLSEVQKADLEKIIRAGKHLLQLINEVLDLARVESGNYQLSLENFNIISLISEVFKEMEPVAEKGGISLIDNVSKQEAVFVYADRVRCKQIMINLLSNGIKYNRENGSVELNLEKNPNLKRLRLNVIDTGIGIPPENQETIFKPFHRLDADNTEIEGTGIGLSFCRKIIEFMGGNIGFESRLGAGSRFYVDIPLGHEPEAVTEDSEVILGTRISGLFQNQPMLMLYIEDNPTNVDLVKKIIARFPTIEMFTASNGQQGIELARSHRPNVILLDIHMAGMDGFEVLKYLKEFKETKSIPVIGLSANAMNSDVDKAVNAGFAGYITKPIKVTKFLSTIDHILNQNS